MKVCYPGLNVAVGKYMANYFIKKGKTNDTLRDLFSRLKMASKVRKLTVSVPYSNINQLFLIKFYEKGLIANFNYNSATNSFLVILKYNYSGEGFLSSISWASTPGRRVFVDKKFIKKWDKKNFYFFFTEKGLFSLEEVCRMNCGGEFICKINC